MPFFKIKILRIRLKRCGASPTEPAGRAGIYLNSNIHVLCSCIPGTSKELFKTLSRFLAFHGLFIFVISALFCKIKRGFLEIFHGQRSGCCSHCRCSGSAGRMASTTRTSADVPSGCTKTMATTSWRSFCCCFAFITHRSENGSSCSTTYKIGDIVPSRRRQSVKLMPLH